jgi:hypothetical protein
MVLLIGPLERQVTQVVPNGDEVLGLKTAIQ